MRLKTMINLMKNIRWRTMFGKFRRIIILCFIIPVIFLDIIVAVIYSGKLKTEIENNLNVAYLRTSISLEEQFKQINDTFTLITQNSTTNRFLTSDIEDMTGREAGAMGGTIASLINNAVNSNNVIKSIGLYSPYSGYFLSNSSSGMVDKLSPKWYKKYLKGGKSEFVYSGGKYITVCHGIYFSGDFTGLIIFELDKERLAQKLRLEDYKLDIGVVLMDMDNKIVFETGNTMGDGKRTYNLSNESLRMTFAEGNNTSVVYKTAGIYFLIYFAASLVLVFVLAFVCSMLLYDSIADILSQIDITDERENVGNIKKMNSTVLETVKNTENIEGKIAQSLNALHTAQLSALQMQINPHFVFNVLNYANSVILEITGCDNDAVRIIVLLCDILQFAMDEPKYETTVEQELEIVEKYIEIERLKTGLDFETVWDVDESLRKCVCLKMFLQPIIENSVAHGFKRARERNGVLKISIKNRGEFMIFTVEDNGFGMTEEKLNTIRGQLEAPFEDFAKHIGIRNVNQRIKLVYGNDCGIKIDSDSGGTTVVMTLRKDKKN